MNTSPLRAAAALVAFSVPLLAQAPPGYYASVDGTNATTLRATLHAVIDDHTRIQYTGTGVDTWDVLNAANENPANTAQILDLYGNRSYAKQSGGNSFYNREHTWPNSYGFPVDGACNYPYTDCHMLFLCDIADNASRGNAPYRSCSGCSEFVTVLNNGLGGGSGVYPGNSNWSNGSGSTSNWETWIGRRGDVARAMFYADLRYEGGVHGVTGCAEPNLIVTDSQSLIAGSSTGANISVAYMGIKSVLVQWNQQDPPDAWERHKNDVVYGFQNNRNPFIDNPQWVECLFNGACATMANYCTAGTTTHGCVASIVGSGTASASAGSGFTISVGNVEGAQSGILFYGLGSTASAWGAGTSFLCVKAPLERTGVQTTGGTINLCNGSMALNFNSYILTHSGVGIPFLGGETVFAQAWFRDPPSPKTTNLSNGLQFSVAP